MSEQNLETTVYITCATCGQEFPFEPGEAQYYRKHQLSLPRHCPACRLERRVEALRRKTSWDGGKGVKANG